VKYGVFKHYLLGMTAVLPSGAIVKLGGEYVKNVTGYDLPQNIMRFGGHAGGDNPGYSASFAAAAVAPDGSGSFR